MADRDWGYPEATNGVFGDDPKATARMALEAMAHLRGGYFSNALQAFPWWDDLPEFNPRLREIRHELQELEKAIAEHIGYPEFAPKE